MSLLLQALQKAAKNREASQQLPEPTTGFATTSGSTLELEPGEIEPPTARPREFDQPAEQPQQPAGRPAREEIPEPSPQQAAVVVGAAAAAKEPGFSIVDWARDHPVHSFAILSGIFLAFYFAYILVEVNYPGFWSRSGSIVGPSSPSGPIVRNPPPGQQAPDSRPAPTQAAAPMPDLVPPPAPGQPLASSAGTGAAPAAPAGPSVPPPAPAAAPTPPVAAATPAQKTTAPAEPVVTETLSTPRRASAAPPKTPRIAKTEAPPARAALPEARDAVPVAPAGTGLTVKTTDDGGGIQSLLAEAYDQLQRGQFAPAQQTYERVLAADSRNIDALLGLASVAWQQGQTEKAAENYYRALQLDPHNASAQSGLIGLMGRVDPTSSETRLKQLISREPSGGLYFTLGNLYAGGRQWAAAQQAYFQAFQLEPTNPDYAFNLAVGLEHLGQSKLALGYYRKALDLSFARGSAGFNQKQVIQRIGELSAAKTE